MRNTRAVELSERLRVGRGLDWLALRHCVHMKNDRHEVKSAFPVGVFVIARKYRVYFCKRLCGPGTRQPKTVGSCKPVLSVEGDDRRTVVADVTVSLCVWKTMGGIHRFCRVDTSVAVNEVRGAYLLVSKSQNNTDKIMIYMPVCV